MGRLPFVGPRLPFDGRLVGVRRPGVGARFAELLGVSADEHQLVGIASVLIPRWLPFGHGTGISIGEQPVVIGGVVELLRDRSVRGDTSSELRVAREHCDDLGRKLHVRPCAVLDSPLTSFAHGDGHLVRRAPCLGRSLQDFTRHLKKKRVVVHRLGRAAPNHGRGFSKGCVRLRAHVEAQDVTSSLGFAGIGGLSPSLLTRDELLDLANGLARAASSHARSVAGVATRASSRTADQQREPPPSAPRSSGRLSRAIAVRSLSSVVRGL